MQPFSLYFKSLYSLSSHASKNVNLLTSPPRIMIFVVVSFSSLFSCDFRYTIEKAIGFLAEVAEFSHSNVSIKSSKQISLLKDVEKPANLQSLLS